MIAARHWYVAAAALAIVAIIFRCGAGTEAAASAVSGSGFGMTSGDDAGVDANAPPLQTFQITAQAVIGQSLGVGYTSSGITSVQPFANVALVDPTGFYPDDGGIFYNDAGDASYFTFQPLLNVYRGAQTLLQAIDGYPDNHGYDVFGPGCAGFGPPFGYPGNNTCYPQNLYGELPEVTAANGATYLTGGHDGGVRIQSSNFATTAAYLQQAQSDGGQNAWQTIQFDTHEAALVSKDAGLSYGMGWILGINGESDVNNASLESQWVTFRNQLVPLIQAQTGQTSSPPVILDQQQCEATMSADGGSNTNLSALEVISLARDNPTAFYLAGPYYQCPQQTDYCHRTGQGYICMGQKFAEVEASLIAGKGWKPLWVTSTSAVTCTGSTVTIPFNVPYPPLVFDDSQPQNHAAGTRYGNGGAWFPSANGWTGCQGFGGWKSGAPVTCNSATIVGNSVVLVFASAVDTWEYGYSVDDPYHSGFGHGYFGGASGNLHDSDPVLPLAYGPGLPEAGTSIQDASSPYYGMQPNWAVIDYEAVTCH
jgi:hypothetical protein